MNDVTQISDNINQGFIAGRDLYLGDQYVSQETLFFEPDLRDVEPPAWTTTPKARELVSALVQDRLIVLAGQDLDNKTMVARHLAWLLSQKLTGEVRVREWYRSSDPQKIESAFDETATTILLLPQVLPHNIGHRLGELTRLLHARHNYTVITTDGTRAEWGIRAGSPEEGLWHEISWETYYGRTFLAETLLTELRAQDGRLPDWLPRDLQSGSLLTEGLTVEEVSVRLKQPDRIHRFAHWLRTAEASPDTFLAQLDQLNGDREAIFQWYQKLERTDQLLALALVLFDGLPDDQIFAAVEYLVDEAWRRTDPNLPSFDYRDLTRLSAYFHLAEAGEDGSRIETSSQQKRETILQAAWELQRRRLLTVVPAMTRLIKQLSHTGASAEEKKEAKDEESAPSWRSQLAQVGPSPESPAKKWWAGRRPKKTAPGQESTNGWKLAQGTERELFSSQRRREQLQRSVIESLSQIGLLSFEAVEDSFLELAVGGSVDVQRVVAKALAAWRGKGHHERLFQVIHKWWEAGTRSTLPKSLAQQTADGADPAAIRATVALAAGYALQYDPPNQLAPELVGLLNVAVMDAHPAVRNRVLEVTLPLAAASHPLQLEALLRDRISQDQEQMYAVAFGVAMAFSLHPMDALKIIDGWHAMVRAQGPREPGDLTITPRDRLLSAVALAYGYIRCTPGQQFLTPEQVIAELRSILTAETHPFVQANALMATGLQGLHHFELVAPMLLDLILAIALPDRKNVVSVFVRAYLKQREQLTGGDGEIESEGRTYQIWTRTPRPLTAIETSLYSWLRDAEQPVARQVAAQALAAFAATDLEQRERNVGGGRQRSAEPTTQAVARVSSKPRRLRRLSPLGYLAVFFAAPFRKSVRSLLRPVMAEVIEVERSQNSTSSPNERIPTGTPLAKTVLDRWRTNDDQEVQGLARSAKTAFNLFRWRWVIILTVAFCSILFLDWRLWVRLNRDPLPLEDVTALQQRRTVPLRLARNVWPDTLKQCWEVLHGPMKKRDYSPRKPPVPRIPSGPMEQLHWSAELAFKKALEKKILAVAAHESAAARQDAYDLVQILQDLPQTLEKETQQRAQARLRATPLTEEAPD